MSHRRIVIGDVHGHYDTLLTLLDAIALNNNDHLYFLGDLIDRGPKSAEVVDFVMKNDYRCLLGNHEQMMLNAMAKRGIDPHQLQGWLYCGGYQTLLSYNHKIPRKHMLWIKSLPYYLDLGDVWLVHAGVNPALPLEKQIPERMCWIRDEFHRISQPYFEDKLIVTGHTITFTFPGVAPGKLVSGPGWIDIDTGAYHPRSGWLTALDITNQTVYQVQTKDQSQRILPLNEAVVSIEPSVVGDKRTARVS